LDGINNKPKDEIEEKAGEVNMKRFFLLFCKLCLDIRKISCDRWVVVVLVASRQCQGRTVEFSYKWYSLGADAKASREVCRGEINRRGSCTYLLQCLKGSVPVAMAVSVFTTKPAN
jgi:hypothetical protein